MGLDGPFVPTVQQVQPTLPAGKHSYPLYSIGVTILSLGLWFISPPILKQNPYSFPSVDCAIVIVCAILYKLESPPSPFFGSGRGMKDG